MADNSSGAGAAPAPISQVNSKVPSKREEAFRRLRKIRQLSAKRFGFHGLLPVVDVMYGAVLAYGVVITAEEVQDLAWSGRPYHLTRFLLLLITSIYLVFDYGEARRCLERWCYNGLFRFALDMLIASAFLVSYLQATYASPHLLLTYGLILFCSGAWVWGAAYDGAEFRPNRLRLIVYAHLFPAFVLTGVWFVWRGLVLINWAYLKAFRDWLLLGLVITFVMWSFAVSLYVYYLGLDNLESGLLPIIPLGTIWRNLGRRLRRSRKLFREE